MDDQYSAPIKLNLKLQFCAKAGSYTNLQMNYSKPVSPSLQFSLLLAAVVDDNYRDDQLNCIDGF